MNYISAKEAAEKWGIGVRRVQYFCAENVIPGAKRMGRQWLIPEDAQRPGDGRTMQGKERRFMRPYRFPLFIHSGYYLHYKDLNEDEQQLRLAQILYTESRYIESLKLCRKLSSRNMPPVIRFGALITKGFCAFILGLYSEIKAVEKECESIISKETEHKEDLRFLLSAFKHLYSWDRKLLTCIEPEKLSPDAIHYYRMLMIMQAAMLSSPESEITARIYESMCTEAEQAGAIPSAADMHLRLAAIYKRLENLTKSREHFSKGCELIINNNMLDYMARVYYTAPASVSEYMKKKDKKSEERVIQVARFAYSSLNFIKSSMYGKGLSENIYLEQGELVHLMMYGLSDEKIAEILNIRVLDVKGQIDKICYKLKLKDRDALIELAKKELQGNTEAAPGSGLTADNSDY